jgi:phage terminase large subunit GpA-like protein
VLEAAATYRRTVVVMGSQMGKTAGLLNVIGHKLDDDPAPILYVGPTKSNIDGVIEPQVAQLLRSAASLWSKTERGRRAQKLIKRVGGTTLRLAWAGSATELASQPAHTVLVDEVDRMAPIPGEGDPVTLAEARIATYPDGRLIVTSTPTEGNAAVARNAETGFEHWQVSEPEELRSPVWRLWQEGTRFEWAVPCPSCGEYFVPRFRLLTWPEGATPRRAAREAKLACARCGDLIDDSHRHGMNARGLYVAPGQQVVDGQVVGAPPESDTASFWASGLMSPWRSWGQRAGEYLRAVRSGDQEQVRTVVNTSFGELFAFHGDAPSAEEVRKCAGDYRVGEVPAGVRLVTMFVDVQKRRLVYAVRGWGHAMESWLLEADEIAGDTETDAPWQDLAELLGKTWGGHRLRRVGVDSGYRPGDKWRKPDNQVYRFARRFKGLVIPTKGRDRMNKPLQASAIDVTIGGKTFPKGLTLWHLDTDYFKSWVHARLQWPEDQPGRWWIPADATDDYCQQITAEARTVKPSGHVVWVRLRRENHFLDCEAGNAALAVSLGVHRKFRGTESPGPDRSGASGGASVPEQAPVAVRTPEPRPAPSSTPTPIARRAPRMNWIRRW